MFISIKTSASLNSSGVASWFANRKINPALYQYTVQCLLGIGHLAQHKPHTNFPRIVLNNSPTQLHASILFIYQTSLLNLFFKITSPLLCCKSCDKLTQHTLYRMSTKSWCIWVSRGVVVSFTRPFSPWLLFLEYIKKESLLEDNCLHEKHETKITWENALPVSVLKSIELFHRVHLNFAKRIQLCIENNGNPVENIISQH